MARDGNERQGRRDRQDPTAPGDPRVELKVADLATDGQLTIKLRRLAGENGLDRLIRHPRVQKSGLALAGHAYGVVPTRVQVLGETELSFLDAMSAERRQEAASGFFALGLSCVVITREREPATAVVQTAEATDTPLFLSSSRSSRTINALHAVLDDRLAPQCQLHGVLVDVFGVGLLLLGKSGIGKSECALELIRRGHRLVADDVVRCDWRPPGMVFGEPADLLRHHIEVRGLGVLNIQSLFGVTSVRERKRIDMVVRLVEWNEKEEEYDRLGLDQRFFTLLGAPIRELTVPVRPGRDMGSILEIAARNELLRRAGSDSARDFLGRLERQLMTSAAIESMPESVAGPTVDALEPAMMEARPPSPSSGSAVDPAELGDRPTWTSLRDRAERTESSAWMPAVRPPKEGD